MKKALLTGFFLLVAGILFTDVAYAQPAQDHSHEHGRKIVFPDIPGFKTLKCDFHIHTVFSDGHVWPTIRVQEAVRDGLDAIALTEHLEYQPHEDDIPHPDRNRSFEIAKEAAKGQDLIIVHGAEVTRDMPPGHTNAIFIKDANKLRDEDPIEVFREVKRQGGFTFWNHPHWIGQSDDGAAHLTDMHRELISEGLLNGIEVVNDLTYSDEALDIALENNLTVMGTSDVHGLVDWSYHVHEGGHRPIVLAFATERSEAGIKEALEAGRTVAYLRHQLVGKEAFLKPLLEASIEVVSARWDRDSDVLVVELQNNSDANLVMENASEYLMYSGTGIVAIESHHSEVMRFKPMKRMSSLTLSFTVLNAITAPQTHPVIEIPVTVE